MQNALVTVEQTPKNSLNNVSAVVSGDLERVMAALLQRDYSRNSFKAIASDMRHFLSWYEHKNGEAFSFQRVMPRDIADYRAEMGRKLAPASVNRRLASVKVFLKEAVELGVLQKSPAQGVKQLPTQGLAPKGLTRQEARKLLKEVEIRGSLRDLLAVNLLLLAGLRASEAVNLTVSDIEISERKGSLLIRNSKGNKTRKVFANQQLRELLARYIEKYKPTDKLLLGERGAIQQLALNGIVGKYAALAGISATPHTLRHTYSYYYLEQNAGDIVGLAKLLGHSSVQTTQIYCQHSEAQLAERVEAVSF